MLDSVAVPDNHEGVARIAEALREIAAERGLSQTAFGRAVGEKQQTISKWMDPDDDKGSLPTVDDLWHIEEVFGYPHGYILRAAGYVYDAVSLREAIVAAPELAGDNGAWRASVLAVYDAVVSAKLPKSPPARTKRTRK